MLLHQMNLQGKFYDFIKNGTKRIELRLFDEKRQKIGVGDLIEFLSPNREKIQVRVTGLLRYDSFETLLSDFSIDILADSSISRQDLIEALSEFYPVEKQQEFGVLGIRFEPIEDQLIAKITDGDLEFETKEFEEVIYRFNTRVIIKNHKGEICLVRANKYNYYQIPGGGIEPGENIIQGLKREASEEAGFEINNITELGLTLEKRSQSNHSWNHTLTYCFKAIAGEEVGTNYMQDEIDQGMEPVWLSKEEAFRALSLQDNNYKEMPIEDRYYSGVFAARRDLLVLQRYLESKGELN